MCPWAETIRVHHFGLVFHWISVISLHRNQKPAFSQQKQQRHIWSNLFWGLKDGKGRDRETSTEAEKERQRQRVLGGGFIKAPGLSTALSEYVNVSDTGKSTAKEK